MAAVSFYDWGRALILFDLFQEMEENDASLLLNPTLPDMVPFVEGVIQYWEMHHLPETSDFTVVRSFQKWISEHFKMNPQFGWARVIWFQARNDTDALFLFFNLWSQFLSKNPVPDRREKTLHKSPDEVVDIPTLFRKIKQRPGQYFGDSTFQNLANYLNGIAYCRNYLGWPLPQAEERFIRFTQWVPIWFDVSGNYPWFRVFLLYQLSKRTDLDNFFKLWDRFDELYSKLEKARAKPGNKRIVKEAAWACADLEYPDGFDLFTNLLSRELPPIERCHALLKRAQMSKRFGNDEQVKQDMLEAAAIYNENADQSKPWWELKILIDFDPK